VHRPFKDNHEFRKRPIRLADFIVANVEPILVEWEVHARAIWRGDPATPATLRDHAGDILRATAADMVSSQTETQRADKSQGDGDKSADDSMRVDAAAKMHGLDRGGWGFHLGDVVAEYRALRASVLRLWRASQPQPDQKDLEDLTRFNESIDQSLTEAVESFTEHVEHCRAQLVKEQSARAGAEAANRAKDDFLATLSHEMRTPLNAIVGWLTILRAEGCEEEDLQEGLAAIDRNTKSQVQLITDILDVSRIVTGNLGVELRPCDLKEVIQAGVDVIRPAAVAKDVALDVRLDAVGRAQCDPARMQQVVWNLLSNGVKFTPKGGTIRVALTRDPSALRLEVSDTGQGIAAAFLPHVFDRFRQSDSSTRRKHGGLGLGLSIAKHLVELFGGTIEAHSAGDGLGATFTVMLPVFKAATIGEPGADLDRAETGNSVTLSAVVSGPPPVRLDGLRVMVVDDEADARRMLAKVLQRVGAVVITANGTGEALARLQVAGHPTDGPATVDVLVSDLGMPDQDGYDLIREIRRRGLHPKDLPAIALTGFAHKDDARAAVLAGFQVHIPKPVDIHDLTAIIASLAGRTG
jgi:signal transduction histidine kinase/ActR/RegA family two-component response regulator